MVSSKIKIPKMVFLNINYSMKEKKESNKGLEILQKTRTKNLARKNLII